jgi:hypothetical protein
MAIKSRFPFKSRRSESPQSYVGLESIAGIRSIECPSLPDLVCPFCGSTDLGFMMGKISFSAIISGDDLFEGKPQSLVTVVCPKSHFFLLREKDLLGMKSVAA